MRAWLRSVSYLCFRFRVIGLDARHDTSWTQQNISDEAKDLVTKLLRKEPQKRLPLDEVINEQHLLAVRPS